jgi:hypothetical protein
MRRLLFLAFAILLLMLRCTDNLSRRVDRNVAVIAEDTMINVLVDMALMEAYLKVSTMSPKKKNEKSTALYLGIFEKYRINRQRLDSTFAYYRDHLDEMREVYDQVEKKLKILQESYHPEPDSVEVQK